MAAEVLERCETPRGELVLRRNGEDHEIISNGVFLMSTAASRSERLLARAPLAACERPSSVLIAGLGVGATLAEVLTHPAVEAVTVLEVEPSVVRWCRGVLAPYSDHALDDPRVRVVAADAVEWAPGPAERYDALCLDVDNGPGWTVTPNNAALYREDGIDRLAGMLTAGGVLAVWSAARSPELAARLRRRFQHVETHEVAVDRGEPDCVLVGARPRPPAGTGAPV